MRNLNWQIAVGSWGALAVGAAIVFRSWDALIAFGAVGLFFTAGALAQSWAVSARPVLRRLGVGGTFTFYAIIVFMLSAGAERVYFVNGSSYPGWLAADLGTARSEQLTPVVIRACQGKTAEIYDKDGGQVVARCGGLMWYDSHTYQVRLEPPR